MDILNELTKKMNELSKSFEQVCKDSKEEVDRSLFDKYMNSFHENNEKIQQMLKDLENDTSNK